MNAEITYLHHGPFRGQPCFNLVLSDALVNVGYLRDNLNAVSLRLCSVSGDWHLCPNLAEVVQVLRAEFTTLLFSTNGRDLSPACLTHLRPDDTLWVCLSPDYPAYPDYFAEEAQKWMLNSHKVSFHIQLLPEEALVHWAQSLPRHRLWLCSAAPHTGVAAKAERHLHNYCGS